MGDIGVDHDVVELTLGGETLLLAESYEVASSILTPPAAFSLRLGSGEEVRALKERYPPGTPFQLAIDGVLQMSGTTDGYITEGSEGATEFTVRGRDALKPVHDKYVESALSFEDATYAELTQAVLDRTAPAPWALVHSNAANRKAITRAPASTTRLERIAQKLADGSGLIALEAGVSADALDELAAEDEATLAGGIDAATGAAMLGVGGAVAGPLQGALMVVTNPTANQRTLQAKVGDRWFEGFLKPELDRAGLMLWATADGDFVLSTPATDGKPIARIYRKRGSTRNLVTVKRASFRNETTQRYSECIVHFRSGGGKQTRQRAYGRFVDQEMLDLGFEQPLVIKDPKCKTLSQADFLARKQIAHRRRMGWSLEYVVAGHTTIGLDGGRIIWAPDIVVEVDDDENGIRDQLYVESVVHRGAPERTTTLRLSRKSDIVFGEEI